jgi:uncharacterized coiled-coil DUF342 family protein
MAFDREQQFEINKKIRSKFDEEKSKWKKDLDELIQRLRDVEKLTVAQVYMLSYRHQLIDNISHIRRTLQEQKSKYDSNFKIRYLYYKTDYDVKLSGPEISKFIKADLSQLEILIDIVEGHLEYYKECVKTLDNMGFALKNRLVLHQDDL